MINRDKHSATHGSRSHQDHGTSAHHSPTDDSAYRKAFDLAQPAAGGSVIQVELDAREVDWEFQPGRVTRAWAFNGQIPGTTIEARLGDVLEIRLTNHLPEPTAIHWHGLRIPAAMDGTQMVQHPVKPGETFVYRFRPPDAGTFWYHPHVNETVQLERGLYGAMVINGENEPLFDSERVLVLDDVKLDSDGQIKPPGGWIEHHDGRVGSTRLINGKQEPLLTMAAGHIERWRIVNAASARYVRLSIGDRPFKIIGTDGGLIGRPVEASEILLAPAERVELAVGPFAEGETLNIDSLKYNRGTFGRPKRDRFGSLQIGPASPSRAVIPPVLRIIEPLVTESVAATREVRLGWKFSPQTGIGFVINKESHHRADPVKVGSLEIWDVINESPIDHPFHLHGFFFQVLEVDGKPPEFLSWKDTLNVPARKRVRIAWRPDERLGEWMYHCHILEHHAGGMMAHFEVIN